MYRIFYAIPEFIHSVSKSKDLLLFPWRKVTRKASHFAYESLCVKRLKLVATVREEYIFLQLAHLSA